MAISNLVGANPLWQMRSSVGHIEADLPGEPAAGAHSRSTSGASALAVPRQEALWLGAPKASLMTRLLGVLEATVSLGGLAGLVMGMYLSATEPVPGVMVILGAMALLVSSLAKLGAAQEVRQEVAPGRERVARSRACGSGK